LKRGLRVKKGSFEIIYLYEKTEIPCLAFAIPKTVGIAASRNRIRRQYREAFRNLVKSDPNSIQEGNYLIKIHSKQSEKFNLEIVLKEALNELSEEHIA
jgi:ribonuclease P protein component|tara:strand:- start:123 stop:419 length:297 start_codon:yes stop_codon:yes gene_type:complete